MPAPEVEALVARPCFICCAEVGEIIPSVSTITWAYRCQIRSRWVLVIPRHRARLGFVSTPRRLVVSSEILCSTAFVLEIAEREHQIHGIKEGGSFPIPTGCVWARCLATGDVARGTHDNLSLMARCW